MQDEGGLFDPFSIPTTATDEKNLPQPTVGCVLTLLQSHHSRSRWSADCNLIALIYIVRLVDSNAAAFNKANWVLVLTLALMIAHKFHDDIQTTKYRDLLQASPVPNLIMIACEYQRLEYQRLEFLFLTLISSNLFVNAKDYKSKYAQLNALAMAKLNKAEEELESPVLKFDGRPVW
jgi:hypothetical protein